MSNNINRLYIHVPFCQNKCAYCAFHSVPTPERDILVSQYFKKLEKDIKETKYLTSPLESIFIGGGTPSYLSERNLEKLFTLISDNFTIAKNAEISIENNPESLTEDKIKVISEFVNRISIGVQSFNEQHRSIIGRMGNNKNIHKVIELFLKNNVNNISLDLIYGIPTQTIKDWKKELKTALQFPIKHLSAYALTFEEGTQLYSTRTTGSEADDLTTEMWELTAGILSPKFNRYEISNYSQHDHECSHNLDTWFGGKYLGLGPTASSFDGKTRWTQQNINEWLKGSNPDIDNLSIPKRTMEIFIMGLRTTIGWTIEHQKNGSISLLSQYPHNLHLEKEVWKEVSQKLSTLNKSGLLRMENFDNNKTKVGPTEKGLLFWNEIALELM